MYYILPREDCQGLSPGVGWSYIIIHTGSPHGESIPVYPATKEAHQVFFTNRSLHRGQVMAIFPLPFGTRTICLHLGQRK